MSSGLDELLIHPRTKAEAEVYITSPSHALLITGMVGAGKAAIARAIAGRILDSDNLDAYPYFITLSRAEDKKDIPIEEVRAMLHKLNLRTPGSRPIRRIIFIHDANNLSLEAQNALLKAMEEPATDTAFILSSYSDQAVLPTIASRAQRLLVQPVSLSQAKKYYADSLPTEQIDSAWQLSQGSAGLLSALLSGDQEHPLREAITLAKDLLTKQPYERLIQLDKLSKDRQQFALLLDALARVMNALQRAALARNASQSALLANRRLIAKLRDMLDENASIKLVVTMLALNLKT
jgi:DNA polymerase III subunit delta'